MREHQLMYRETARKYELVKQIETAITYAGTHILGEGAESLMK